MAIAILRIDDIASHKTWGFEAASVTTASPQKRPQKGNPPVRNLSKVFLEQDFPDGCPPAPPISMLPNAGGPFARHPDPHLFDGIGPPSEEPRAGASGQVVSVLVDTVPAASARNLSARPMEKG